MGMKKGAAIPIIPKLLLPFKMPKYEGKLFLFSNAQ
jgi:hypothetical protein